MDTKTLFRDVSVFIFKSDLPPPPSLPSTEAAPPSFHQAELKENVPPLRTERSQLPWAQAKPHKHPQANSNVHTGNLSSGLKPPQVSHLGSLTFQSHSGLLEYRLILHLKSTFTYFLTWETSMSVTPVYACPIYVCPIYVCSGCSFIYAPFIHLLHTDIFHVCWWKCSTRVAEHPHPFRGGLLKPSSSQSCLEARAKQSGFSWTFSNLYISHRRLQTRKDLIHIIAYSHFNYLLSTFQKINVLFKNTMMNQADTGSCPYSLGARGAYVQRNVLRRWHLNWEWKDASSSKFWNRWGKDILGRGSHHVQRTKEGSDKTKRGQGWEQAEP